jgi:hypothetical protein
MIKFIEPNTSEWYRQRIGVFTASQCSRLFGNGKRKMTKAEIEARDAHNKTSKLADPKFKSDTRTTVDTLFGSSAITYINEKVSELINKKPKMIPVTKCMQWGLTHEGDALQYFEMITGIKCQPSGLFKINDFTGGTPDAHIGIRKIQGIIEVKCLNPEHHSEICELSTGQQLRDYEESYWAQCQMNCYVTGAKYAYFVSFDPRPMGYTDDGELDEELYNPDKFIFCIKYIKIKRDEVFIKELEMRLYEAALIVSNKIQKRMKSAEKNLTMYNRTLKKAS